MKNRTLIISAILCTAMIFTGCGPEGKVHVEEPAAAEAQAEEQDASAQESASGDQAAEDEDSASEETASDDAATASETDSAQAAGSSVKAGSGTPVKGSLLKDVKSAEDNFKNAMSYARRLGTGTESIDYGKVLYQGGGHSAKTKEQDEWEAIEAKCGSDSVKQIRMTRADLNGSTIDFTVYTDPSTLMIDKITACEFCAAGREMTDYYYKDGEFVYAYSYLTDVYGTTYEDGKLPGKKCFFTDNALASCYLNDADVDYKNVSYTAADYSKLDDFTKTQYDQLEESLINMAYITYDKVKDIPSTAVISGYVGDEFGGILSNVGITLSSKANKFTQTMETNGDGYFEARVPVNTADNYGMVFKYGTYPDSTVDDIFIRPGTVSYSLGVVYMSEEGAQVHERNTYLLNANESSPVALKDGEYCVTLGYDVTKADLLPFSMNVKTGKSSNELITVIKPGKDDLYRYFVTDQRGGHSGNPMTYEMSTSQAMVKVYDKNGLTACFQVPVNHAGVVWEAFSVQNGEIVPSDNYYYEASTDVFFQ